MGDSRGLGDVLIFGVVALGLFVVPGLVIDKAVLASVTRQFIDPNYSATFRAVVSILAGLVMLPSLVRIMTAGELLVAALAAGLFFPIADLLGRLWISVRVPLPYLDWVPRWLVWFPATAWLAGIVLVIGVLRIGRWPSPEEMERPGDAGQLPD